jgi:hypothetical protein
VGAAAASAARALRMMVYFIVALVKGLGDVTSIDDFGDSCAVYVELEEGLR